MVSKVCRSGGLPSLGTDMWIRKAYTLVCQCRLRNRRGRLVTDDAAPAGQQIEKMRRRNCETSEDLLR